MGSGEIATRQGEISKDAARPEKLRPDAASTKAPVNLSFPDEADAGPRKPDVGRPLALLSFDVEQFDIPTEYGIQIDVDQQFEIGRAGLATVLELLDTHEAPATFFITAEFAQRYTRLVRSVVERGRHEIASHGYTHGDLEEGHLKQSRQVLQDIIGQRVRGFRRARMAETDTYAVAAAGYTYNASENPIWLPGRYNHFFKPRKPYVVNTSSGPLVQIPASATPLLRIPLFWLAFKNMPEWATRLASTWVLKSDNALNTYFHPWEFTDIGGYELPKVVKKLDGKRLVARLSRHIAWLKERSELATYNTLAERAKRGQ